MRKKSSKILVAILVIILVLLSAIVIKNRELIIMNSSLNKKSKTDPTKLIAHGGGEIYGITYTNSLEALNKSYSKGFRYIELDFRFTKDDKLVLMHDWEDSLGYLFNREPQVLTHKEFKEYPTVLDLTLMDIDDLIKWLDSHKDVYIITDTTDKNLKVLRHIKDNYPDHINRFKPQIYNFYQYDKVKEMGYDDIILTLYLCYKKDEDIVDFVANHDLYAVTIEKTRAEGQITRDIIKTGTRVYAHTVNTINPYKELTKIGVHGFYTDYFEVNNYFE